jgi:hypothetical protein
LDKALDKAKAFFATTAGRALIALSVLVAIIAYAHHRGVVSTSAKFTAQVEQLKQQLADAQAKPAPEIPYWECNGPKETRHPNCRDEDAEADTADRLKQAETAKAALEKKVKDYEAQLARRPAKGGSFALSPADARSLSNIK